MTIDQAKNKLISWAVSQIGTREGANNWNKYAAMANIERLYGGSIQNAPWCDVFTDAAFVTVFGLETGAAMTYQTVGNGSALCRTSAAYFKEHGAFTSRPEPGDVIFFYVGGVINHQGIVTSVTGSSVITVEGNSSDMVAERVYSVQDGSIAGYGRPRWELTAGEEDIPTVDTSAAETADSPAVEPKPSDFESNAQESGKHARTYTLRLPYLRRGDEGPAVRAAQRVLISCKCTCGPDGVDGEFGPNTEKAVLKFQIGCGLSLDGIIGPETGATLFGGEIVQETSINGLGAQLARKIKEGE